MNNFNKYAKVHVWDCYDNEGMIVPYYIHNTIELLGDDEEILEQFYMSNQRFMNDSNIYLTFDNKIWEDKYNHWIDSYNFIEIKERYEKRLSLLNTIN
jgi:hypothetical protein